MKKLLTNQQMMFKDIEKADKNVCVSNIRGVGSVLIMGSIQIQVVLGYGYLWG